MNFLVNIARIYQLRFANKSEFGKLRPIHEETKQKATGNKRQTMKNVMMYLNNNWFSIQLPDNAMVSSDELVIEIPEADNMSLEKIVAYMVRGFNKSFWLDAELRKDAANKLADLLYSELPVVTIIRLMIPHWDDSKTKVSPERFLEMDEIQILANQILYLIEYI